MGGNLSLEEEIESIAQSLWNRNMPILCYPIISVQFVDFDFQPQIAPLNHSWVAQKVNTSKVIFVLPATTLSGGIRVVFEVAEGLSARGIDTEIWSLISPISWEITAVPLKQFNSYLSMIHALQVEDAIKVATWWETADVVFLSSINHGLPVQFVQEFETWFYPDDRSGQAAVVSCYRPEFQYLTTASYQFEELLSIGIQPKLIPVGYDSKTYFQLENVDRQSGVILALGRSFFQKNFKMTARAWNRISHTNLRLWLFGHEPGILTGHNVSYYDRPSNSEVNELLNKAEVFVQTSIHEGFSLPIIEAMAAGCPVITTDSHGNRDFCSDRVNCLVVEQNNDEQLAKLISELLGDPSLRRRLSEEGLATARNYQWSGLLDRYHAYFSAFLKDLK
jgi:glycosyltransferase involved in cell wall biosynthesis